MKIKEDRRFRNLYWILDGKKQLATKSIAPGYKVYDEVVKRIKGEEYRMWNPYRSKLSATVYKGLKTFPFKRGSRVLYLGVASGTTASHVSDVIGEEGVIFGIEIAHRVLVDLLDVVGVRRNIVPIMESARRPQNYTWMVPEVDVVYEDVAQPDQASILVKNADIFLKEGGVAMIAVKASSIDVTLAPREVYRLVEREVTSTKRYELIETVDLAPYDPKHAMMVFRKIRAP